RTSQSESQKVWIRVPRGPRISRFHLLFYQAQRLSIATVLLRSIRMPPLTVDRSIDGPPAPSLPSRFCPMGKCFFVWRPKSLWIPPVNVWAETFALASVGKATVKLPLTDLSETDFFNSAKSALTEPLTVDNST